MSKRKVFFDWRDIPPKEWPNVLALYGEGEVEDEDFRPDSYYVLSPTEQMVLCRGGFQSQVLIGRVIEATIKAYKKTRLWGEDIKSIVEQIDKECIENEEPPNSQQGETPC